MSSNNATGVATAVIMAAGLGSRFGHMTESRPKGFIEIGGVPMIVRAIEMLLDCGIEKIVIGTGHCAEYFEELGKRYPQIVCCRNEAYAETNSMYTLYGCRSAIDSDFILLESDLIFERRAIASLIADQHENVMLGAEDRQVQEYLIEADGDGMLRNLSVEKSELNHVTAEFVGIHKLSLRLFRKMCEIYAKMIDAKPKQGYEYILLEASGHFPCYVKKIEDLIWYEIDNEPDLEIARSSIWPALAGRAG